MLPLLSKNESVDLSIIIVNWNSWDDLQRCILSVQENTTLAYEILVIDNHSSDASVENISRSFPDVTLICNEKNVGFPAANNQAFAIARGRYFLMLNPDTLVKKGTLEQSLCTLQADSSIGCLGVKTLRGDGEILLSCARSFPSLWSTLCHLFYLDTIFKNSKFHRSSNMPHWDHQDSRDVDMLHGGYMMFPRSIYETLGGLDEKNLMFYEDVEYCCRIKKAGYRIYYLADVEIVHFVGTSISKANPKWITGLYCETDYLYFLEYGGGRKTAWLYVWMLLLCFPIRIAYSPFIWLGSYIKTRRIKKMSLINVQIFASASWAIRKLFRG